MCACWIVILRVVTLVVVKPLVKSDSVLVHEGRSESGERRVAQERESVELRERGTLVRRNGREEVAGSFP